MQTKTYSTIKGKYQKTVDKIIEDFGVFFAFSNDRFDEHLAKINAKIKDIQSIGSGGFILKTKAKDFFDTMDKAESTYKKELKDNRDAKDKAILYELINHECFYTCEIDDVVDFFKGIYTIEAIKKVYLKNKNKYN